VRVSIAYPPLPSDRGVPLLSQNRQFQWFTEPTYIYPMVPAYAATLLKGAGHEVTWDDGIASEQAYEEWKGRILAEGPDLILMETKTPVIKRHWRIIEELKEELPGVRVALAGDHVTALPLESFQNSPVDYVLTGGTTTSFSSTWRNTWRGGPGSWSPASTTGTAPGRSGARAGSPSTTA